MSEARKKADELVYWYSNLLEYLRSDDLLFDSRCIMCALICVEEIINQLNSRRYDMTNTHQNDRDFWFDVKKELNKMK